MKQELRKEDMKSLQFKRLREKMVKETNMYLTYKLQRPSADAPLRRDDSLGPDDSLAPSNGSESLAGKVIGSDPLASEDRSDGTACCGSNCAPVVFSSCGSFLRNLKSWSSCELLILTFDSGESVHDLVIQLTTEIESCTWLKDG